MQGDQSGSSQNNPDEQDGGNAGEEMGWDSAFVLKVKLTGCANGLDIGHENQEWRQDLG